jgi:hypothetical protein
VPFTFQVYPGKDPPFVGLALNVTDVPAQIVVLLAEMSTAGLTVAVVVTDSVRTGLEPQAFTADTLIKPLDVSVFALIDAVLEVPVQPDGMFHK